MKILFDATEPEEQTLYNEVLAGNDIRFLDTSLTTPQDDMKDAEVLSVFVSSTVSRAMIETMPNLKCIATRSMGFDHIDKEAAKERGIAVVYVPSYGTRTVAEFAFALILALSRKAYAAYDLLRSEGSVDVKRFEGFDLSGKTIGVVGTGKIGKNMARIAKGFNMNVLLCDTFHDDAFAQEIGCSYFSLDETVAQSDIVSLHVPLMPATKHMINAQILARFKRGSMLINTARGGLIETRALVEALNAGVLGSAGLDVIEGEKALFDEMSLLTGSHPVTDFEELVAAHALVDMPNVIVTPHIAFNTREAKHEIASTTAQNIASFIGGTPQNTIPA
jgi:D-lactate dehydrogenase